MTEEVKCKHPGCDRPKWRAFGYCGAHYQRFKKGKDMDAPIRNVHATDAERFWSKVDKSGKCWIWTGAKYNGYGVFRIDSAARLAHRVSYKWAKGDIPDGEQLDHMCHNRACVNPDHVRFADHALNGQNRASANRNSKSGIRGVYWVEARSGWMASIMLNREMHRRGPFDDIREAEQAAIELRREHMPYSLMDRERKAS
ncbi:HNH endonuclease signature motif containing protein [Citricoccus sp. K5]|uniref:HNH endonuclease signature motif containing protein n=1 Tax=Citricoccus sp. K5 TaxID=2653135 RepID=UPI0012F2685A|nr:HNH endonuclease signature motif containing protein [Citricoccus sp. K5]VXB24238.1 conserved hypothetical protein [Citricoccus sp. K5]